MEIRSPDSHHRRMKTRAYILLASVIIFNSLGNILLSKGMKQVGEIHDYGAEALGAVFFKTFTSGTIWLGICSLIVFFISYLLVLSWADYSYVQPASALGYAVVPVFGYLALGENISPLRWIAVLFICAGVALVGGTDQRTVGE